MTTNGENQTSIPVTGPVPAEAPLSRGGAVGAAVLAVIIVIALLDAVVETIWSGSPIRWWVAPPVVLFAALAVWLWRPGGALLNRTGPGSAASTLIGGLLLLLAATAWLPGGQTDGVRMLGQPTSIVLAAAVAAVVALAVHVVVRGAASLPPTPRLAVRIVFALLGLYALAALGLAVRDGASFAALFQGGAMWQRLPRWLQGSFLGALVLLPAAILAQVVRVFGGLRRKEPVGVLLHQATALVMCFVMALSGVVLPGAATGTTTMTRPAGAAPPEVAPPTAEEFAQSGRALFGQKDPVVAAEEFVRVAEQELRRPGADPSDISARAAALGRDAGQIFEFMRDQIALEPYVGVLRGARGTLAAGAGNALDRALLARELLRAAGVESRLVSGTLAASQADALLERFFSAAAPPGLSGAGQSTAADPARDVAARDVATKAGVPPEALAAALRRAGQRSDVFAWKADEQRAAGLDFLSGQLRKGGLVAPRDGQAVRSLLRDRLKEHYWLEVKDASGAWAAFDPTFADARLGAPPASDPVAVPETRADRFHRFELQVIYRTQASSGKPRSEILLKHEAATANVLFEPLELRIQPGEQVPDVDALQKMNARQRAEMLRAIKRFQTMVRTDSAVVGGRGFDLEGHTFDAKSGDSMGGPAGMMGGMLGFGGDEQPAAFLDLQVVLRLSGPGRESMTQTRTIVRAADMTSATFAPPIGEWQVLVQPQWISQDLAGYQMLSYLTGLNKNMAATLKARSGLAGLTLPPPVPQLLLQFAVLRQNATARILAGQPGLRAFIDRPMLTIAGHQLSALRPDEGLIIGEHTIDIVENAARFVSKDPRSQAAFDGALQQGVADCTLERLLLQEAFPGSAATSGSTVFERAKLEGRQPMLVGPRDAAALRAAGLDDADVEWIGANEGPQSRLLVARAQQGPAAWWSVRPDGTTVLRVSGGQGQAMSEHAILIFLKILALYVCGVEILVAAHEAKEKPSNIGGFTIAWCILASGASGGFALIGAHALSWALLAVEAAVMLGSQYYETYHGEE